MRLGMLAHCSTTMIDDSTPQISSTSIPFVYHTSLELLKAIERNELVLHYQPILNLHTNEITSLEALVRWQHPIYGLLPPASFIHEAESDRTIIPLGKWVLERACQQLKQWHCQGCSNLSISINMSVVQLQEPEIVDFLEELLYTTNVPAQCLCLEITETIDLHKQAITICTLNRISKLGIRIAIDDFGTGFSSFQTMREIQLHTLKIDSSFIRQMTTDRTNTAIVTTLIELAQKLNIRTVAEGVEALEQLIALRKLGCDEIQGYHISKPLPADQCDVFFESSYVAQLAQ